MSERNNSNKKIIVIEKIQKEICSAQMSHFPLLQKISYIKYLIVTVNLWVFLQVPSSQKKQIRCQTIEFSWGLYCLVELFLLLLQSVTCYLQKESN